MCFHQSLSNTAAGNLIVMFSHLLDRFDQFRVLDIFCCLIVHIYIIPFFVIHFKRRVSVYYNIKMPYHP